MNVWMIPLPTAVQWAVKRYGGNATLRQLSYPVPGMETWLAHAILRHAGCTAWCERGDYLRQVTIPAGSSGIVAEDGGKSLRCNVRAGGVYRDIEITRAGWWWFRLNYDAELHEAYAARYDAFPAWRNVLARVVIKSIGPTLGAVRALKSRSVVFQTATYLDREPGRYMPLSGEPADFGGFSPIEAADAAIDALGLGGVKIPKRKVYEWKAESVAGASNDWHLKRLRDAGWRKVPPKRHPELPAHDGAIRFGGVVLMEISAKKHAALVARDAKKAAGDMERVRDNQPKGKERL